MQIMQRYFSDKLNNNKFTLSSDDLYHINKVMRMKTGELMEVIHNETVYICELTTNNDIEVKEVLEDSEVKVMETVLCIPLLKEQKMDFILQKATELGVDKIIPVIMERSIVKVDNEKSIKKIERWQKICKEASEQSKRHTIPEVTEIKKISDLGLLDGTKIICSTSEKKLNLKKFMLTSKNCDKIVIVIGPEGGLSNKEEDSLVDMGYTKISLGKRILRVETVPMFILSVLNYEFME